MAHHLYQTKALILRGSDVSEANRFIDVFTRELGLVRAIATSARKEYSKMRYALQDYSVLDISLVRGRNVWRITGANENFSAYYILKDTPEKLILFKKVHALLRRLLHGEEKNEMLFDVMQSFIGYVSNAELDKEKRVAVELLTVLRILYSLGYVARKDAYDSLEYTDEFLNTMTENKMELVKEINEALMESQL